MGVVCKRACERTGRVEPRGWRQAAASLLAAALAGACGGNPIGPSLAPTVPASYSGRCNDVQGTVTVGSRDVVFQVWDDGTIDGDIISLIVDGNVVLSQFTLAGPGNKKSVNVTLSNDGYHYVILYAHNVGSISPNTAAVSIGDGVRSQTLLISANLLTNGAYNVIVGAAPPPASSQVCR